AAITARIATFLPMVLLSVLFPEVAASTRARQSALPAILLTLALTMALSGAYALLVFLFPEFVVTLLFGAKYAASSGYLPVITAAMALLAVINVLFSAFLAKSRFEFLYPTYAGLAMTAGLIYFWLHDTPGQVALGVLIGCAFVLTASVALLVATGKGPRQLIPRSGQRRA
ncbi:MAG: polysaccharide biosynthesis protein, partial [Candidatus Lambdaproteobacteria bacterium]|nr:polysaccharide biosynthesis protein [Candidatus Lambdaproteobacteria bacterium]